MLVGQQATKLLWLLLIPLQIKRQKTLIVTNAHPVASDKTPKATNVPSKSSDKNPTATNALPITSNKNQHNER